MSQFVPGVVEVDGRRCLIIADAISHTLADGDVVLLEQIGEFNIFCSAEELAKKKAQHGGLPVYGYWQTLYHSQHWTPESGIVAYRDGASGQYVSVDLDEKSAVTGEVVNGVAIASAGEVCDPQAIRWIDIKLTEISLPKNPAMTLTEQLAQQRQSRRTFLLVGASLVLALIVGAILGGGIAHKEMQVVEAELTKLNNAIAMAQASIKDLSRTRLLEHPKQSAVLNLLESLSWVSGFDIPISAIDDIQLSVPHQSYSHSVEILSHYGVSFDEQWLADGTVVLSLR